MILGGYMCKDCGTILYSRAPHDFRRCKCGKVFVDGGFTSYGGRVGFTGEGPEHVEIEVNATEKELYDDWNRGQDVFGIVGYGRAKAKAIVKSKTKIK